MASIRLLLNKQRMLNNGTYPLVFQIIHRRKKLLYYTKYRVFQQQFDDVNKTVGNCVLTNLSMRELNDINRDIRREYKRLLNRIKELEKREELYSVNDIIELGNKKKNSFNLLHYMGYQVDRKKTIGKEGIAAAYQSTLVSVRKYLSTIFVRKSDFKIEDIDSSFVIRYEDFLYSQRLTENTVNYYLRNFRTIYNAAIRDGCKSRVEHPFAYIHTKPCKTIKRAIDKERMKELLLLPLPEHSEMMLSRDLYLFSFYAQGMAFVDIAFLKKIAIHGDLLSYYRHKSRQLIHIVITEQMQELIDKYANDGEYVFPIIDETLTITAYEQYRLALGKINRYLKKIASISNINIRLTTYTARHTWATLARDSGAPISVISAGLGHTSEEMTRVYLKDFDKEILADVNRNVTNLL